MPIPMEHPHEGFVKGCEICFQNSKDILANKFYVIAKRFAMYQENKIAIAMIKMYDPAPKEEKKEKKK